MTISVARYVPYMMREHVPHWRAVKAMALAADRDPETYNRMLEAMVTGHPSCWQLHDELLIKYLPLVPESINGS